MIGDSGGDPAFFGEGKRDGATIEAESSGQGSSGGGVLRWSTPSEEENRSRLLERSEGGMLRSSSSNPSGGEGLAVMDWIEGGLFPHDSELVVNAKEEPSSSWRQFERRSGSTASAAAAAGSLSFLDEAVASDYQENEYMTEPEEDILMMPPSLMPSLSIGTTDRASETRQNQRLFDVGDSGDWNVASSSRNTHIRRFDAMSKTTRNGSPPSWGDQGGASSGDVRHVDTKPRLGGSSGSSGEERGDARQPRRRRSSYRRSAAGESNGREEGWGSSDEIRSESPPSGQSGGSATGFDDEGKPKTKRGHSPLSDALKFWYSSGTPKAMLDGSSGSNGSSEISESGSQGVSGTGGANDESSSMPRAKTEGRRRKPQQEIMSDAQIVSKVREQQQRQEKPQQARGAGGGRFDKSHRYSRRQHPGMSHSTSLRGRSAYRRNAAMHMDTMNDIESYSDVEVTADSGRYGRPTVSFGGETPIPNVDPEWLADAKDPRFEGGELKRTDEAKEIAEGFFDTFGAKQEDKPEAKQEPPELMHYVSTAFGSPAADVKQYFPRRQLQGMDGQDGRVHSEVVDSSAQPESTFFAPFVLVYRTLEDRRPGSRSGLDEVPHIITRYGSSFALDESQARQPQRHHFGLPPPLPPMPVPMPSMATATTGPPGSAAYGPYASPMALETPMPNIHQLMSSGGGRQMPPTRNKVVEGLQDRAPQGVIVLGGQNTSRSVLSRSQAADLVSYHEKAIDDGSGNADATKKEPGAKDNLDELLAQKAARKPPRRSARPLAPAGVKLSAEERVTLERERNREHARNTRLRKKAALANLTETVEKLLVRCEKTTSGEQERRARAAVKRACIETFFRYRARAETSAEKWGEVVTGDVELWQPVTPHRSFRPAEVVGTRRLSKGLRALVEDAASLAVLFRSIGRRGPQSKGIDRAPRFVFEATIASRDQSEEAIQEAFSSDVVAMHWLMRTMDAVEYGLENEVSKNGMLVARFDRATCKVKYVEFVFDVQSFAVQIQRTLQLAEPPIVPNSEVREGDVHSIIANSTEACVVTTATRPHVITDANDAWLKLCGVDCKEDCVGQTLKIIQGEHTDDDQVEDLLGHVNNFRAADTVLVNYRVTGEPFLNYLRVFPLYKDDRTDSGKVPDVANLEPPVQYLGILKDIINDMPSTGKSPQESFQSSIPSFDMPVERGERR